MRHTDVDCVAGRAESRAVIRWGGMRPVDGRKVSVMTAVWRTDGQRRPRWKQTVQCRLFVKFEKKEEEKDFSSSFTRVLDSFFSLSSFFLGVFLPVRGPNESQVFLWKKKKKEKRG